MSNYNGNKNYGFNGASKSYKKSTYYVRKSPVEYDEIEIVGTRPVINRNFHQLVDKYNFHKQVSNMQIEIYSMHLFFLSNLYSIIFYC